MKLGQASRVTGLLAGRGDLLDSFVEDSPSAYWFEGSAVAPTVRNVVDHPRLMLTVDLSYPVILGHDGRVMDRMHRLARALLDGVAEVSAVRFPSLPEPDYRNIQPDQLTC